MSVLPVGSLDKAVPALQSLLGQRATTGEAVREHHSRGESYHPPGLPDIVCFPETTEEVCEILKISAKYKTSVIPYGAGTSVEGQVNANWGGITVDLSRMNKVVRVSVADLDATVQAGVTRKQLNRELNNTGLTFFIDPGADATLGGMAATRASGTTAVRYGTMRENVLGLTAVLADGRVINTGTRARKSSAGYDLTHLFVGSEGTLGVITEVTLRLHPLPEAVSVAVCAFDTLEGAVDTVIETIQLGVGVARVELLNSSMMQAINQYSKTDYEVAPTLFFEFHGDSELHVADQTSTVEALAAQHGGRGFRFASKTEDREALWAARHNVHWASLGVRPGARTWSTDVCVPISRLAECIREAERDALGASFPTLLVGHVGDGNFHQIFVLDPKSEQELADAARLSERGVLRALAMGGTCTGEHGVGSGKIKYIEAEHGPAIEVMRTIKRSLDPDNRMNPGKMIEMDR
jgi:D-lactate dehydrogenase (cytochrome)